MSEPLGRRIQNKMALHFEAFILVGIARSSRKKHCVAYCPNPKDAPALNALLAEAPIASEPIVPTMPPKANVA